LGGRLVCECDVVHFQSGDAVLLQAILALRRRLRGVPTPATLTTFHVSGEGVASSFRAYTIEGRDFARGLRPRAYRTLSRFRSLGDRLAISLSDGVNATSARAAEDVFGFREGESPSVVHYGLEALPPPAAPTEIAPVDLLYVGLGGHRKRVLTLPFVLRSLRQRIEGARLRIIGFESATEPRLADLLDELGLVSAVDFVGVKRSEELTGYYEKAGVLVVPSAYEGLPLVILEAMRSGLPVVATRVSGHPEVIRHGVNGFLVDVDEPREMARHCALVLTNHELRAAMAREARREIREGFDLDRQVEAYLDLYRSLLGPRGQCGADRA
jgi:glycosyltransferase involved in cell wall biosynthesis